MSVTLVLEWLKQKDCCKFEVNLGSIGSLRLAWERLEKKHWSRSPSNEISQYCSLLKVKDLLKSCAMAGVMIQLLRTLATFAKDPDLIPSTHTLHRHTSIAQTHVQAK